MEYMFTFYIINMYLDDSTASILEDKHNDLIKNRTNEILWNNNNEYNHNWRDYLW